MMTDRIGSEPLRFVVLNNPYGLWSVGDENSTFRDIFHRMIGLKIRGYGAEYPVGVLPVDTTDLFASHLLVCMERGSELHPVCGFKSTLLKSCDFHQVNFPALSLVQSGGGAAHVEYVSSTMERCRSSGRSLAYTGSWTIDPEVRKDRPLARRLVELFRSSYVLHHLDSSVDEVFTGGTVRFKADILLSGMGHSPLYSGGRELDPLRVTHLFGESVRLLHLREFSQEAIEAADRDREMWENRIEISIDSLVRGESGLRAA